ncbi:MAG: hypothetical protein ACRDN9_12360 [Streptosporangiaceae bacterium]
MGRPRVYVHIGAPKTGTTFLQQVLWSNRRALARQGVTLPGKGYADHFRATQDLREKRQGATSRSPSWRGEWDALARQARRARTSAVVISCELLAAAGAEQARRAIASLEPAEVHVVYTARELTGLLTAAWQEQVKHRYTGGFDEWLAEVIEGPRGSGARGWFWRVHDPVQVLRRWSAGVPPDRVHVVPVPPAGTAPDLLWQRFSSVLGVDPGRVDAAAARPNTSLGLAETELLRRVNAALDPSVPFWHYAATVKDRLAHDVLAARPDRERVSLPDDRYAWTREHAERVVAGLRAAGYDVVGDLGELLPSYVPADRDPREVTDAEILDVAVHGLAGWVAASLRERTDVPARVVIERAALDLGARIRPVGSALRMYRRLALRLRRP